MTALTTFIDAIQYAIVYARLMAEIDCKIVLGEAWFSCGLLGV